MGKIQTGQFLSPSALEAGWQDFVPKLYTTMNATPTAISSTIDYARYRQTGTTVWAQASVAANALTSGGVGIDLPIIGSFRSFNCGSLYITGTGATTSQAGIAFMGGTLDKLIAVTLATAFCDISATGQKVRYSVCYEVA